MTENAERKTVFMSTESALKQAAVSTVMAQFGSTVDVDGKKVDSGVNEQPMTLDETYDGAMNRHKALKALGRSADYFITVESGLHQVHKAHGTYGCTVVIVEPAGQPPKVGFDLDVEFSEEWLSQVPSPYADTGVLVQAKYGATEKDPITYLTGGRLTRGDVIQKALFAVIAQLPLEGNDLTLTTPEIHS